MFTEKRGGGAEVRQIQRQREKGNKRKCTLAITVLEMAGRQVLNSQLTLHLRALWGTGWGHSSQRALTLPQDSNVTLGLTGCDGQRVTGPLIKWVSLISWFISSLAKHFSVHSVDLESATQWRRDCWCSDNCWWKENVGQNTGGRWHWWTKHLTELW